ncbi:uncharacterized protein LOC132196143 [Neocloeon triangulifer]|uniref:uncharacterized protein LOC132196143 n=1 Tax=Neocloeon triangulifer TaxID=2078957 RepID=UPI00286F044F|nr:uncharacterized protein LOC132196143 [Neocloeon triangulifer]
MPKITRSIKDCAIYCAHHLSPRNRTKQSFKMAWSGIWTAVIFLFLQTSVKSEKCHLTGEEFDSIFPSSTPSNWKSYIESAKQVKPDCLTYVKPALNNFVKLSACARIVDPDEAVDEAILDSRVTAFLKSFETLKSNVDAETLKLLNDYEKKNDFKNTKTQYLKIKQGKAYPTLRKIFKGETSEAVNETESLQDPWAHVDDVISRGFDPQNTTYLKYLIDYAYEMRNVSTSVKAYTLIFNKMKEQNLEKSNEIVLLAKYIDEDIKSDAFSSVDDDIKEQYKSLAKKILPNNNNFVKLLTTEISSNQFATLKLVTENLLYTVVNFILPEVVEQMLHPDVLKKAADVFQLIGQLPSLDNDCVAADALYHQLSRTNNHESFEAFNLWLYLKHVVDDNAENFANVDEENRLKCTYVKDALTSSSKKHLERYTQLVQHKEWRTLTYWHTAYNETIRWILRDVVQKIDDPDLILEFIEILPFLEENCIVFEPLVEKLPADYNSLKLFALLRDTITVGEANDLGEVFHKKCLKAKAASPDWVRSLLWKDTSKCRVINAKNGEPLVATNATINNSDQAGTEEIYTLTSEGYGTKWNVTIDKDGDVYFENNYNDGSYLFFKKDAARPIGSKSSGSEDGTFQWNLERSAKGFFHIAAENKDKTKKYLSLGTKTIAPNYRIVELTNSISVDGSEWKIEC